MKKKKKKQSNEVSNMKKNKKIHLTSLRKKIRKKKKNEPRETKNNKMKEKKNKCTEQECHGREGQRSDDKVVLFYLFQFMCLYIFFLPQSQDGRCLWGCGGGVGWPARHQRAAPQCVVQIHFHFFI